MPDDIKTEDDKPVSPFIADGDKKQGDTAEERTEHPDPAQPATYNVTHELVDNPSDDEPLAFTRTEGGEGGSVEEGAVATDNYVERTNPVATEGTTEVPASGYQFADPNDPIRARYVEMERQKDEDIAKLVKMGDGKPKV